MQISRILFACVAASWLQFAETQPAHAEFYKCISSSGDTTYDDSPCRADQSIHVLTKHARELPVLDCRVARNFAFDIVARMRQGDTANEVFDAYGGVKSLSADARSLINNVYSFNDNSNTGTQRIVDLTVDRCQSGLLGKKLDQCDAYPKEFIERFGSCIEARQVEETTLIQPEIGEALPASTAPKPADDEPVTRRMAPDDPRW